MVTSKDHEEERKRRYRFQLYKMRGSGGQGVHTFKRHVREFTDICVIWIRSVVVFKVNFLG